MVSDTDSPHPVDIVLSLVVLGSSVQWFIIDYRAVSIGVSSSWEERLCDTGRSRRQLVGMDWKRNIDKVIKEALYSLFQFLKGVLLKHEG